MQLCEDLHPGISSNDCPLLFDLKATLITYTPLTKPIPQTLPYILYLVAALLLVRIQQKLTKKQFYTKSVYLKNQAFDVLDLNKNYSILNLSQFIV